MALLWQPTIPFLVKLNVYTITVCVHSITFCVNTVTACVHVAIVFLLFLVLQRELEVSRWELRELPQLRQDFDVLYSENVKLRNENRKFDNYIGLLRFLMCCASDIYNTSLI